MSGINAETVVMVGAALAGAGQVQANEGAHADETTISWTEAQRQALMAELKEQCAEMSDGVQRVLDTYDLDKLKEVKATLRTDGQKFNYMLEGNKYSLSGGFDGKPLNMEIVGQDGSRVQTSQGDTRSSAAMFDENGQLTGVVQKDERTGNIAGRFQSDDVVLDVTQKGQRVEAQLQSEDMKFAFSQSGNRMAIEAEGEDMGHLKGTMNVGRGGAVSAHATYDDRANEGEISEFDVRMSRHGEMKLNAQTSTEYGTDTLKAKVDKQGYTMESVEDGEKEVEKGTEVNAATLKAMMERRLTR